MSGLSFATYGTGKPLILLHGWGFSKQIWAPLLPKLTSHFQVTLIDLPGHGQSSGLLPTYSLEKVVEHLVQVTPAQARWLGWSLGGLLSLAVAHYHPQHIKQLLLVASTPKFVADEKWEYGISADLLAQFSQQLQAKPETTLSKFVALQTMGSPQARQETRQILELVQQQLPSQEGLRWGLQVLQEQDFRTTLQHLTCPVHALFGAKDTLVDRELADYLPQLYPQVKTQLLTEAAHMPFYSHSEQFLQWLNSVCSLH